MLRKQIIAVKVRLQALYHQRRTTPDERRSAPEPETTTGRNPVYTNAVRMTLLQGLNLCPFTLHRAMPDAIDIKGL
jgi:hypothetical protein